MHLTAKRVEEKKIAKIVAKEKKAASSKSSKNDSGDSESPSRIKVVQCAEKARSMLERSPSKAEKSTTPTTDNAGSDETTNPSYDEDLPLTELMKFIPPKDANASAETPAEKSPKTPSKKLSSTPLSARKRSGKPTYISMVHEAIVSMKERTGSSAPAISKWILANNEHAKGLHPNVFKTRLALSIKQGVKENRLMKVKNSYKISVDVS